MFAIHLACDLLLVADTHTLEFIFYEKVIIYINVIINLININYKM